MKKSLFLQPPRLRLASVLLALVLPTAALGSDCLIRGGTVLDVTSGRTLRADVATSNGRISAIGPQLAVKNPGCVINAEGLAVLPGLFDLHTHWTPAMQPSSPAQVANAWLASGFTWVNDFHQAPEAWQPRREWLARLQAPEVRFAARISTPLGHGADWADQATTRWVNSPDAARAAVRGLLPYRPDFIKVFTDGWRYGRTADNSSMDEETLTALVSEAHAHQLKVMTHTVTAARAKQAARAGVDVIAHSIMDQPVDDELVALMKKSGTAIAPTLAVYEPQRIGEQGRAQEGAALALRQRNYAMASANLYRLHQGGVAVVLGTDAGMPGTPHGRAGVRELELLVASGLTPQQALRAATLESARAMGVDAELGSIEVGKRADLVLVAGKPWQKIDDMLQVRQVFRAGQSVFASDARPDAGDYPNTQPWPAGKIAAPLLDDFEQGERTALDTLRTGEADAGNERSWQVIQPVPRAEGGHALLVTAQLSSRPAPHASVVFPLSRGSVVPMAVNDWQGVEFEIRGSATALALQLRGVERRYWQVELDAPGNDWHTVRVPFAGAVHSDWSGKPLSGQHWNGVALIELVIIARGPSRQPLWYQLDNLRFYR